MHTCRCLDLMRVYFSRCLIFVRPAVKNWAILHRLVQVILYLPLNFWDQHTHPHTPTPTHTHPPGARSVALCGS